METREQPGWRDEVLRQLDAAAEELFPGPPNENYPSAAVALDGFASDSEWLLVFQVLSYGRPGASFGEDAFIFGNRVEKPGYFGAREVVDPLPGEDFWSDDEEERFIPELTGFSVLVNGTAREYSFSNAEIDQVGAEGPDIEPELAFIRVLAHYHADQLFRTPEQILVDMDRPGLSPVFRLDGWRQPDSMLGEKPSDLPCFQAIADSLAQRRPIGLEVCAATGNTHWSNWLEFE